MNVEIVMLAFFVGFAFGALGYRSALASQAKNGQRKIKQPDYRITIGISEYKKEDRQRLLDSVNDRDFKKENIEMK
jgi:hypothetical protein